MAPLNSGDATSVLEYRSDEDEDETDLGSDIDINQFENSL